MTFWALFESRMSDDLNCKTAARFASGEGQSASPVDRTEGNERGHGSGEDCLCVSGPCVEAVAWF